MIYPQDKRNKAQIEALKLFERGFNAFVKQHLMPPAMNEGDFSKYHWAGWAAAREVLKKSKKEDISFVDNMENSIYDYDDPVVSIKWVYSK